MGLITNIKDVASAVTERKNPSAENKGKFYDPNPTNEGKTIPNKEVGGDPSKPALPISNSLTADDCRKSGISKAYLYTTIIETLRGIVVAYKHSKSLTPEEKTIKNGAVMKPSAKLSDIEIKVLQKYALACEKYERKKSQIRTTDTDMEMLIEGFGMHTQATGKKASPNLIIGSIIVKHLKNIAFDAMLD